MLLQWRRYCEKTLRFWDFEERGSVVGNAEWILWLLVQEIELCSALFYGGECRTKANKIFFRDDYGASLIWCFGPMQCIRLKERL